MSKTKVSKSSSYTTNGDVNSSEIFTECFLFQRCVDTDRFMLVYSTRVLGSEQVVTASFSVDTALTKNRVSFLMIDPREKMRLS